MPELINPDAALEREMQKRGNNAQLAAQLLSSMLQGQAQVAGGSSVTPAELVKFALAIADGIRAYVTAPLDEPPSRLV